MQTNTKRLARRIVGSVLLVALFAAAFLVWDYRVKARGKSQFAIAQVESHDFGSQMVNYTKQGRYEDAIQVGLHALQNQPSDESVYQQIAVVYFIRAQKDSHRRQEWVTMAVSYVEKVTHYPSIPRTGMSQAFFYFRMLVASKWLAISRQVDAAPTTSEHESFWRIVFRCCKEINLHWREEPIRSPLCGRKTTKFWPA